MMDIMDSGIVQANMTKDDVIATCQAMYNAAFATVENNKVRKLFIQSSLAKLGLGSQLLKKNLLTPRSK